MTTMFPIMSHGAGEILRIFHFWWRQSRDSRLEQGSPIDTHEMPSSGEHWESETKDKLTLMNIMCLFFETIKFRFFVFARLLVNDVDGKIPFDAIKTSY